jgi:putative ABC transport system permease protein
MSGVALSPSDLALAASLLIINGAISIAFGLKLERSLALAAIRMVVQLTLVGFVLRFVLEQTSPAWTVLIALIMVLVAGFELYQRKGQPGGGWRAYGLGNATLLLVGGLATLYAVAVVVRPSPWYAPRYVLPILGMVLGNTLTSVSLALQAMSQGALRERNAIDARIALGATRFEAFAGVLQPALRAATTPLLNTMAVAGVVALPGMMSGQIMAGADPAEAAMYQIMILFVLAGASALGALAAALGSVVLMTDRRHRLRLDRFGAAPGTAAGGQRDVAGSPLAN